MARIALRPGTVINYVPIDDRGDAEPLTIGMKYVPYKGNKENKGMTNYAARIDRRVAAQTKGLRLDDFERRSEIQNDVGDEVDQEMFIENVTNIENFIDIQGIAITDPKEFYETIDTDLRGELVTAMKNMSKLTEGQIKNSSGGSGGISKLEVKKESPSAVESVEKKTEVKEIAAIGEQQT